MIIVFRSFFGAIREKSLPVVEFTQDLISSKRIKDSNWQNNAQQRDPLIFTGLDLAKAVIKADFLNQVDPLLPGIALVLQSEPIINWNSPTLTLKNSGIQLLTDFVETSLTGRLGQGISILFAEQQGYSFHSHLSSILQNKNVPLKDDQNRFIAMADFVCEDASNNRCLLEAKCSFRQQHNHLPTTKSLLKKALNSQISPWMKQLNPPATKSFVTATYVRDNEADNVDQSVLAFVDPEEISTGGEIDFSSTCLRRENYAAWLTAMGLRDTAKKLLRQSTEDAVPINFFICNIDEFEIAFTEEHFTLVYWESVFIQRRTPHDYLVPIHNVINENFSRQPAFMPARLFASGIEVNVLQAIAEAIQGNNELLQNLEPLPKPRKYYSSTCSWSLSTDKTFFGNFRQTDLIPYPREFIL